MLKLVISVQSTAEIIKIDKRSLKIRIILHAYDGEQVHFWRGMYAEYKHAHIGQVLIRISK